MSGYVIARKVVAILIGVGACGVLVVLARVKDQSASTQYPASAGLEHTVRSAQTWEVAFPSWSGKPAPDFMISDTDGHTHNLTDYHGRDLLVVFWATWCPACNEEIPHLIELRKIFAEEELGILAISNESPEQLKQFAAAKGINYTVAFLGDGSLPAPFSDVTSIPTSFFIDRDGKIKLAALGVVPLEEAKAIIKSGQG